MIYTNKKNKTKQTIFQTKENIIPSKIECSSTNLLIIFAFLVSEDAMKENLTGFIFLYVYIPVAHIP